MKPEAFDNFCRTQLEQLNEVPQLNWNENSTWHKLTFKMGKDFRIFTFTAIVFLLAALLLVFVWKHQPKGKELITDINKIAQKNKVKEKLVRKSRVQSVDSSKLIKDDKKDTFRLTAKRPVQQSSKILTPSETVADIPLSDIDSIKNEFSKQLNIPVQEKFNELNDSLDDTPKHSLKKHYQNKPEIEVYSSIGSNSHSAGINYVKPLSQRFSLVYGLHTTKTYNPYFNLETHTGAMDAISLQVPFQIRYYLLPEASRLTVFLYAGLTGAFPLGSVTTANYSALSFETGAEARYRLWASKDGKSKGFFFVRMPFYRHAILKYNNADQRLKNSHALWFGETFR